MVSNNESTLLMDNETFVRSTTGGIMSLLQQISRLEQKTIELEIQAGSNGADFQGYEARNLHLELKERLDIRDKIENLLKKIKREKRLILHGFESNVLAQVGEIIQGKLEESGADSSGATSQQIAIIMAKEKALEKYGITGKHEKILLAWMRSDEQEYADWYFDESQRQFAELIIRENSKDDYFNFWDPLFKFCFDKGIEEMAVENRRVGLFLDMLLAPVRG